ncbi:zinc metalloprotease [Recurvomyces mirabilis]|nr:zinc metalloprotease [Recurvomyces mirabilis]
MDLLRRFIGTAAATLDNPAIPWKVLITTFAVGEYALETYLSYRQYQVLQRKKIPVQLKEEIDQKTFDKSQAYGRAKFKFGLVSGVFNMVKSLAVLRWDGYAWLWSLTGIWLAKATGGPLGSIGLLAQGTKWYNGTIAHSLLWTFTFSFAETLLSLPFSYYHHFVLEETYGFNKQTLALFFTDLLKSQGLSLGLGIPIGSAFLYIIDRTGESFFLYLWLFTLALQLGAITVYPILIVPLFNKLTPLEPGTLRDRVHALADKLHFPLGELQVIDGSKRSAHSNAYFTGLPWKKKIVIYDTLIEKSEVKEVEAILAHELGHWKMGHTTQLLGISAGHLFFVFMLFSVFVRNGSLYEAFGFWSQQPTIIGFILFNEVLSPTDAVVKLGMNVWTRRMEFQADEFSLKQGYAAELATSLIKLQIQNLSAMDADWMYSTYNYSHPILTERLKAIGWTSDRKVGNFEEKKAAGAAAANGGAGHKEL